MWAIIGGTGFEKFEDVESLEEISRETPFGLASSGLKRIRVKHLECLFLSRHGSHHELLPSEVNYRANLYALKQAGATRVLSISAVGSLRQELAPGDLVVPTQYLNFTKGTRESSFCGDGMVGHVSLADPVWQAGVEWVLAQAGRLDCGVHGKKTYVCVEGPYFSTRAESHMYRQMGADIIGMTHFPEYALAREAGISYLPCCFVTDYDCWDDNRAPVTVEEVIGVMKQNNHRAFRLVTQLLESGLPRDAEIRKQGLGSGLMTPVDQLSTAQQKVLAVLDR